MGGSFSGEPMWALDDLQVRFQYPDMQFFDADLESCRACFATSLTKAVWKVATITSPLDNSNRYGIGGTLLLDADQRERIESAVKESDDLNTKAADDYMELFKLMRSRLGLDLRFRRSYL